MSTEEDIYKNMQRVQHFIEQCLVHFMTQKQVKDVLKREQNIDPIFTESVWQLLEEHNPEFFKSYYLRLILKVQITEFNNQLAKQAALLYQTDPNRASYPPMAYNNGSRYVSFPSGYINGGPSKHSGMQRVLDRSRMIEREPGYVYRNIGPHPANTAMVPNSSEEVSSPSSSDDDISSSELYRRIFEDMAQADMEADFANRSGPNSRYRRM